MKNPINKNRTPRNTTATPEAPAEVKPFTPLSIPMSFAKDTANYHKFEQVGVAEGDKPETYGIHLSKAVLGGWKGDVMVTITPIV